MSGALDRLARIQANLEQGWLERAALPPEASAPSAEARVAEALLFASPVPLSEGALSARLPAGADVRATLEELGGHYAGRGVNLVRVAGGWAFRTAHDLSYALAGAAPEPARLSRAAMEVLAIIAYHQPATRAEIEEIRGVSASKGTLDTLLETGWIRLRGRRRVPGRPVTYGTTPAFLSHFGLDGIADLPGLDDLKALGFLEGKLPSDLRVPMPSDEIPLRDDEEPIGSDAGEGPE